MSAPFLVYTDGGGRSRVLELPPRGKGFTIGRRASCDLALPWDDGVSRLHAQLVRMGSDWVIIDEGLSRNGTFVNGERLRGRHRLAPGDVLRIGGTLLSVGAPELSRTTIPTRPKGATELVSVTPAQRRTLVALSRPLRASRYAAPASNREIADELVISVETVKGTLSALFERFGLTDLPQSAKRAALAARALELLDQR
jgi:pSer/pThr/pTyr-binding forkhead associated (FHA) protein